jgi:uncharacterized protein YwgA
MNRYELAKIVEWAGTLNSRKRMQKVVYLLQAAGCPLEAKFILHHYGPYSHEVAALTDEMVGAKLLNESHESGTFGERYSYDLSAAAGLNVAEFERTPEGLERLRELSVYEATARGLLEADLKDLEVASTIVFFRKQGHDWPIAIEKSCRFKDLAEGSPAVREAEELARRIIASTERS